MGTNDNTNCATAILKYDNTRHDHIQVGKQKIIVVFRVKYYLLKYVVAQLLCNSSIVCKKSDKRNMISLQ